MLPKRVKDGALLAVDLFLQGEGVEVAEQLSEVCFGGLIERGRAHEALVGGLRHIVLFDVSGAEAGLLQQLRGGAVEVVEQGRESIQGIDLGDQLRRSDALIPEQ